jgi:hypothetical protein
MILINPFKLYGQLNLSDVQFRSDTFEKGYLDGRWKKVQLGAGAAGATGEVVDHLSAKSAKLTLPAGARYDVNSGKNDAFFVYQDVVAGEDFDIITKINPFPDAAFSIANTQYQSAAICYYLSSTNFIYVAFQVHASGTERMRWAYRDTTSGNGHSTSTTSTEYTIGSDPSWLRLTKTGTSFELRASDDDGATWQSYLTQTLTYLGNNGDKLGMAVGDYHATPASAAQVSQYFQEIHELSDPDYLGTLILDEDFTTWTVSTVPDGWNINNSDANNYVEENANGIRFVSDGSASPALGLTKSSFVTVGKTYQLFVEVYSITTGNVQFWNSTTLATFSTVQQHALRFEGAHTTIEIKSALAGCDLVIRRAKLYEL